MSSGSGNIFGYVVAGLVQRSSLADSQAPADGQSMGRAPWSCGSASPRACAGLDVRDHPLCDEIVAWPTSRIQDDAVQREARAEQGHRAGKQSTRNLLAGPMTRKRPRWKSSTTPRRISRVAQTSLREMVGSSLLSTLLSEPQGRVTRYLRSEIGRKAAHWRRAPCCRGDPATSASRALEDAMSRQAQPSESRQSPASSWPTEQEGRRNSWKAADIYARNRGSWRSSGP